MIIRGYKDNIIQQALRVAYDQTHDQTSISQGHKVSHTSTQSKSSSKGKEAKHYLEAYDLYIFLPLWQQVTKKFKYA